MNFNYKELSERLPAYNSKVISLEFMNEDFSQETLSKLDFRGCTFRDCNFYKSYISDCNFSSCVLSDNYFSNCVMYHTNFSKSKIRGGTFTGIMSGINLSGAKFLHVNHGPNIIYDKSGINYYVVGKKYVIVYTNDYSITCSLDDARSIWHDIYDIKQFEW